MQHQNTDVLAWTEHDIRALIEEFAGQANEQAGSLPSEGFVRIGKIVAPNGVLPISRASWWDGIASGRFPPPTKLGPNTSAWGVEVIRAVIEELKNPEKEAATNASDGS